MELWKNIPGYQGYQASSLGRIRSFWNIAHPRILSSSHFLNPTKNKFGYYIVSIKKSGGKCITRPVHRLVLLAFKGDPKKHYGLHKNDIPSDNRIENLYWGSQKQNNKDMWRNKHGLSGERCPWAKLSSKDVKDIKNYVKEGWPVTELARGYGVSHSLISMIISERRWHVPDYTLVLEVQDYGTIS